MCRCLRSAWQLLVDIQRIATCMPGAELTEVVDDQTYKGKLSVPLGPVAFAFNGVMKVEEVNPDNHTTRVTVRAADAKQSGGANATASFRLEPRQPSGKPQAGQPGAELRAAPVARATARRRARGHRARRRCGNY
jgi:carbon monoxide dehydrogenase subunit G